MSWNNPDDAALDLLESMPFDRLAGEILLRLATPGPELSREERMWFAVRALRAALDGCYARVPESLLLHAKELEETMKCAPFD